MCVECSCRMVQSLAWAILRIAKPSQHRLRLRDRLLTQNRSRRLRTVVPALGHAFAEQSKLIGTRGSTWLCRPFNAGIFETTVGVAVDCLQSMLEVLVRSKSGVGCGVVQRGHDCASLFHSSLIEGQCHLGYRFFSSAS